jgi:homoserine trans-succinylase
MPIKIPSKLPAKQQLEKEQVKKILAVQGILPHHKDLHTRANETLK